MIRVLFPLASVGALLLCVGCTGMVVDPEETVATFHLKADTYGALLAEECVNLYGEDGCSRYPNFLECDSMTINVLGDARTCSVCQSGGKVISRICGSVADGIPFLCHTKPDLSCHQCTDVFGNTVLDTCGRGTQAFRAPGGGWSLHPDKSGELVEPGNIPDDLPSLSLQAKKYEPVGPNPPGGGVSKCDPSQSRLLFVKHLNAILASEGLDLTYVPDMSRTYDTKKGYWGYQQGSKKDLCKKWLSSKSHLTKCWVNEGGRCHCKESSGKNTCRCSRINVFALREACQGIPDDCDYAAWVGGIVMEYGVATQWLFKKTYSKKGYYGGLPSQPTTPHKDFPKCLGSPLVLDLDDDGLQLSSQEDGVRFDLMGHGAMRSAWVGGDDGLLVLDRNGNGRIDDGTELFGSATDVDGGPAEDGFVALAVLDRPGEGGNDNGILDRDDLMFGELRVWNDRNSDGVSQPEELRALRDVGIASISVTGSRTCGSITDAHGNDLSLRSSFHRDNGSTGLVVDVFLAVGR